MKKFAIIAIVFIFGLGVEGVKAWSSFCHGGSVYVAEQHLTPRAKKMCRYYLKHTLPYYASWMDSWKGADAFKSVNARHSVMITADDKTVDMAFDEYGKPYGVTPGECMGYLRDALAELGEGRYKNQPDSLVRQRLVNMVHYVADMHCPSHINYPKDKYPGYINNRPLVLNGKDYTYHAFWDWVPIYGRKHWTIEDYGKNVDKISRKQAKAWQSGTLEDWGRDLAVAGHLGYKMLEGIKDTAEMSEEQMLAARDLTDKMSMMAAYRLAHVLNTIFKY